MLRGGLVRWCWLAAMTLLLAASDVYAAAPASAVASPASVSALSGLYLLASAGYGASTQNVRRMDLAPYGLAFGLDAGFTFTSGLHLGAYFDYSLGSSRAQQRDPLIGRAFDYDADTSALNAGLRVAYDVPLYGLVLRYKLGIGISSMKWDFGDVEASDVLYGDVDHPNVGFHVAPGAALLWPFGTFVAGAGFDYLAQVNGSIPSAFLGKLLIGVKL
jgi:hypothetical protein